MRAGAGGVELQFFGDLQMDEIAHVPGVSRAQEIGEVDSPGRSRLQRYNDPI